VGTDSSDEQRLPQTGAYPPELLVVIELSRISHLLARLILRSIENESKQSDSEVAREKRQIGNWLIELGQALREHATRHTPSPEDDGTTRPDDQDHST
jgi:hypothetical protein